MSHQMLTKKNYDFFEVSSAFQKSIRRGLEEDALFWATELMRSNYHKYLWKRMIIMVSEDIGLANPDLPSQIMALHAAHLLLKDQKSEWELPTFHAILLLVRSSKSRIVDWAKGKSLDQYYLREHDKRIPDYAVDIHTRRGKLEGKTIHDFFKEGAKLHPHDIIPGESEYLEWCFNCWTDPNWDKTKAVKKQELENQQAGQTKMF